MLSGTLTRESLMNVFRNLSIKQRQGVLEVTLSESYYELCFYDGTIVEVNGNGDTLARDITKRLLHCKLITKELTAALSDVELMPDQLYDFLVGERHVDHNAFLQAKRACEHDMVMSLRDAHDGFFNFTPKLIKFRPELSFGSAPSQLLLDMIEYDSEYSRFEDVFDDQLSGNSVIRKLGEQNIKFTDNETVVWKAIGAELYLKRLNEFSLLSSFDFQQALLSLYDRNLIGVANVNTSILTDLTAESELLSETIPMSDPSGVVSRDIQEPSHGSSESESASLPSSKTKAPEVDGLIDKAVSMLRSMDTDIASGDAGFVLQEVVEDEFLANGSANIEDNYDDLSLASEEDSDFVDQTSKSGITEQASSALSSQDLNSSFQRDVRAVQSATACELTSSQDSAVFPTETFYRSANKDWQHVNYVLLETRVIYNVTIIIVVIFLIALGIFAPQMLDTWFNSLMAFSSESISRH